MHKVELGLFKIAQTRVNWEEVGRWLECVGVDRESIYKVFSSVGARDFVKNTGMTCESDAAALIALAGKRCYKSFTTDLNPNISKIRTDLAVYITNILKSGHGSVFEHPSWTFAIENVSRVFTGEMNRHRAGTAISEGSMRFIRYDNIGYWEPDTITEQPYQDWLGDLLDDLNMSTKELDEAKAATRLVFQKAFEDMEDRNQDLSNIWKMDEIPGFKAKKLLTSMFRRVIGMGIATGGVWTMNARAMRHILQMRGSVHAEEEIYQVFDRLMDMMQKDEPLLFGDFKRTEDGWCPKYSKV